MSNSYRKIKYQEEGPYGSLNDRYLYIWSQGSMDITHVFDDSGDELFVFSETGFDMGQALVTALTKWDDEKMELVNSDEWKEFKIKIESYE